jgi:uncharacterized protein YggE
MTVSETAKTGPAAKEAIRASASKIEDAIERLRSENVTIKPDDVRVTYSVDKAHEYRGNRNVFAGYTATYVCSFRTKDVEEASRVHDLLTSLSENIECDSPSFRMNAEESLREAALAKAWEEVKTKLGQLCRVCAQNEDLLTISSVSVGDDRGGGHESVRMAVASAAPKAAPIKLSAGKPEVSVTLTVNYEKI